METILIFNGLGNQMSQYAFYLAKKQLYSQTQCIYYPFQFDNMHNGFELSKVFGVKFHKGLKYGISYLGYNIYLQSITNNGLKGKIYRKLIKFLNIQIITEQSYTYNINIINNEMSGWVYYWGGWHNELYFRTIREELLNIFRFKIKENDKQLRQLVDEFQGKNSVSIHIRRGDYLKSNLIDHFGSVCSFEYYHKAINYIEKNVENPFFYIFTDDKQWVSENFIIPDSRVIDFYHENDSWKDMYLISLCKHHINANSTFSWWGAWLNHNPQKIVLVPKNYTSKGDSDIYPESWIKIQSN